MAANTKKPELPGTAERLATLRRVYSGENQTAFAARIGIEVKRWNNFERGMPLSKDAAIQLVRKVPGLTLDWLFLGIDTGLPVQLQRELAGDGNANTSLRTSTARRS